MVHQEEGWPLGLHPLNMRGGGHIRSVDVSFGSKSFRTFFSDSLTSFSDSSSDFDTESTGAFFQDRSITLGRLIGITTILDIPTGCSHRGRRRVQEMTGVKKSNDRRGSRTWFFSLCLKARVDDDNTCNKSKNAPSLGDFLQVERRTSNPHGMQSQSTVASELEGLLPEIETQSGNESNSPFSNGCSTRPPRSAGVVGP